jgi:hypothetical protein
MPYFKVRDLMINVVDERFTGKITGLCLEDQPTQLNCGRASPIMHMLKLSPQIERTAAMAQGALKSGVTEVVPALKEAAADIGLQLVAGAAAGGTAMPDPECGGTSGIPSPLTPVAFKGSVLVAADLPALKSRVRELQSALESIESKLAPRGGLETEVAYDHLRAAAESLKGK